MGLLSLRDRNPPPGGRGLRLLRRRKITLRVAGASPPLGVGPVVPPSVEIKRSRPGGPGVFGVVFCLLRNQLNERDINLNNNKNKPLNRIGKQKNKALPSTALANAKSL